MRKEEENKRWWCSRYSQRAYVLVIMKSFEKIFGKYFKIHEWNYLYVNCARLSERCRSVAVIYIDVLESIFNFTNTYVENCKTHFRRVLKISIRCGMRILSTSYSNSLRTFDVQRWTDNALVLYVKDTRYFI